MSVFHLNIDKSDLSGASLAILPGDPGRVQAIAESMDSPKFLSSNREYTIYLAYIDSHAVIVCSTGIGGPSTSIAVEELAQLGIDTFLRVGTSGAIQPYIDVADIVITTGSVRLDGASYHYAPAEYPAVSDFIVVDSMRRAAESLGIVSHLGITASSDTFYPGQERYDTLRGRVLNRFKGSVSEWQSLGVLNFEMESATLLTMCSSLGLRAGCLSGVIINRCHEEAVGATTELHLVESRSIQVVVLSARNLLTV